MEFYARTDLACENFGQRSGQIEGAKWSVERIGGFSVGRLRIESESAEQELGKPRGVYVTVECGKPSMLGEAEYEILSGILADELRQMAERLTEKRIDSDFCVLVAGLGNAELTADAIGPKTVQGLTATRHLREYERRLYRELGCCALSALATGVLGQTGIETQELVLGAVRAIEPDLVLAVDALAARSCDRLASTVQISDVGIQPGSGVGNHRAALTEETLGVPVIAIGVPTVVDSATLVYDALREAGIDRVDPTLESVLHNRKSFFVSLKESDAITESHATLLARSIGQAFTGIV